MVGGHSGVDALGGVGVHQRQGGAARLEALGVVLGVDHSVLAPEAPVLPVLQTGDDIQEGLLVIVALDPGCGIVRLDAAHNLPGAHVGEVHAVLTAGLLPHAVENKELVIVGAHIQGDHTGLVLGNGVHVRLSLVQGGHGGDVVLVHQVAPGHVHIGSDLLIVHGQHVDLAAHLGLLPGLGVHGLGGHGGVGLQVLPGDLPEALLGGLGVVEAPVGGIDDVPVLAGGEDQGILVLVLAPAHELHVNSGVDLGFQTLVDLAEHLVVVHRPVADEVHGQGDFLGYIGAGGLLGIGRLIAVALGGGSRGIILIGRIAAAGGQDTHAHDEGQQQ